MYLSRAWVSGGKCIRLVQMMNLHHLDGGGEDVKHILAPARDWTELEERRRTFWAAFCCDRYSCAGTGWPMTIDERDVTPLKFLLKTSILTNLDHHTPAFFGGSL